MGVSAHQKGKRILQGSGVLTRYMYRNILSVAIIYTNYDPKPHPPGVNIWAVIHTSFQNHYQIFSNEIKRDTPRKLTPSRRLMRFATHFIWDLSRLACFHWWFAEFHYAKIAKLPTPPPTTNVSFRRQSLEVKNKNAIFVCWTSSPYYLDGP